MFEPGPVICNTCNATFMSNHGHECAGPLGPFVPLIERACKLVERYLAHMDRQEERASRCKTCRGGQETWIKGCPSLCVNGRIPEEMR